MLVCCMLNAEWIWTPIVLLVSARLSSRSYLLVVCPCWATCWTHFPNVGVWFATIVFDITKTQMSCIHHKGLKKQNNLHLTRFFTGLKYINMISWWFFLARPNTLTFVRTFCWQHRGTFRSCVNDQVVDPDNCPFLGARGRFEIPGFSTGYPHQNHQTR